MSSDRRSQATFERAAASYQHAHIALLNTFPGHINMEPAEREHPYREIRRRLAVRPDGRLARHWSAVLTIGRRVPSTTSTDRRES